MKNPLDWTEKDLHDLLGLPESFRLEFKSGELLSKSNDGVARDLAKEVSAFANSEGGVIVIGLKEDKPANSKARVASAVDGVKREFQWNVERLQQLVEASVSPYLPGLRFKRIPLSSVDDGTRSAFVIVVPQGSTAFQAKDCIYYGRSEFEAKALPDHEIRLRMMRGRAPSAELRVLDIKRLQSASDEEAEYRSEVARFKEVMESPDKPVETILAALAIKIKDRFYDKYSLKLGVVNTGEVSLRDFALVIRISCENFDALEN